MTSRIHIYAEEQAWLLAIITERSASQPLHLEFRSLNPEG